MRSHALAPRATKGGSICLAVALGVALSALASAGPAGPTPRAQGRAFVQSSPGTAHYLVDGQLLAHNDSVLTLEKAPPHDLDASAVERPLQFVKRPGFHPDPPEWLSARFEHTLDQVRTHHPNANVNDVRGFLHETYEHVREMNALIEAMGGRSRALPEHVPSKNRLGGVHDFGEHISAQRLRGFVDTLDADSLRSRDGNEVPMPQWLRDLADGTVDGNMVDVSKLSPHVAVGLGRSGPPDPHAIALHRQAPHHHNFKGSAERSSPVVLEAIADQIHAMRQLRIYRQKPMPAAKIRDILNQDVDNGRLPEYARGLIDVGLQKQLELERNAVATRPYYLLDETGGEKARAVRQAAADMSEAIAKLQQEAFATIPKEGLGEDAFKRQVTMHMMGGFRRGGSHAEVTQSLNRAVTAEGLVDNLLEGRTLHVEGERIVDPHNAVAHMLRTHAQLAVMDPTRLNDMQGALEYLLSTPHPRLVRVETGTGTMTWVDEWGNEWGGLTSGGH